MLVGRHLIWVQIGDIKECVTAVGREDKCRNPFEPPRAS